MSVWTKYSKEGVGDNHAWFSYNNGNIDVKNPDEKIKGKMHTIAKYFKAKLQGDELEIYEERINTEALETFSDNVTNKKAINVSATFNKKPWWKFWARW